MIKLYFCTALLSSAYELKKTSEYNNFLLLENVINYANAIVQLLKEKGVEVQLCNFDADSIKNYFSIASMFFKLDANCAIIIADDLSAKTMKTVLLKDDLYVEFSAIFKSRLTTQELTGS